MSTRKTILMLSMGLVVSGCASTDTCYTDYGKFEVRQIKVAGLMADPILRMQVGTLTTKAVYPRLGQNLDICSKPSNIPQFNLDDFDENGCQKNHPYAEQPVLTSTEHRGLGAELTRWAASLQLGLGSKRVLRFPLHSQHTYYYNDSGNESLCSIEKITNQQKADEPQGDNK